jgi:ATP-dependent helicase HrpB
MQMACLGENQWQTLMDKDLVYYLESLLPNEIKKDFETKCPAKIRIPSGKQVNLHYSTEKPPHLEIKLQELFGMQETPRIWNQEVPITLHLLAPNYRPVQTTSDLASFWKNTYPEVKKELKARYPKHRWD